MPAILGPAAQNIQRDVAGFTHASEPNPGAPVGFTMTDFLERIPTEYGDLHHLFSEALPTPVETAVAVPTEAARGPHGGLRYQIGKWIPVGPELTPWDPSGQLFRSAPGDAGATAPPTITPGVGFAGTGVPGQPAQINFQPYGAQNVSATATGGTLIARIRKALGI